MLLDIIYSRVSTDEQAKDGKTSIDDQITTCKRYLERLELTNFRVFQEDYSGFSYERPELDKIKQLMIDGKVRSFTAMRVDRLCRKSSILEQLRDGYFKPLNIEVHTVNDLGKWLWNPNHETLQESLAVFASNWGKMAVEVLYNGRKAHVKAGNVMTCRKPPYGYSELVHTDRNNKRIGSELIIEDFEAQIIRRIYDDFVNEDKSLGQIARDLNNEKIPTWTQLRDKTPFREKQLEESKSPHQWRTGTIAKMLRNSVYDGRWQWGRTRTITVHENGKLVKKKKRFQQGRTTVECPRLVSSEIWNKARKILESNKKDKSGQPTKYEYLMRKRLTCICGYKTYCYTRNRDKYFYQYYVCPAHKYGVDCEVNSFKSSLVDDIAHGWLYNILRNKNELKSRIDNYLEEVEKSSKPLRTRLEVINKSLEKKHSQHDAILSSVIGLPELARAKLLAQLEQLEATINELEADKAGVEKELTKLEQSTQGVKRLTQQCKEIVNPDNYPVNLNPEQLDVMKSSFVDTTMALFKAYQNDGTYSKDIDFTEAARVIKDDGELTFEEKLQQVEQFDLRGELIREDGEIKIRVSCVLGSEVLSLLYPTLRS